MQAVAPQQGGAPLPTAALCYGHMPLMLTRACPLRNTRSCAQCPGGGTLRDRKGRDFAVTCTAPGSAGVRTVYNPVPLYMGDRLTETARGCGRGRLYHRAPGPRRPGFGSAAGRPAV